MVQAVLNGTKTQTRRVVKPQPRDCSDIHKLYEEADWKNEPMKFERVTHGLWCCSLCGNGIGIKCPYGKVGDELWVRETFSPAKSLTSSSDETQYTLGYIYKADEGVEVPFFNYNQKWKPSIFMPREASRIQLRITDIRVERLQDISEEDAVSEGIESFYGSRPLSINDCWKFYGKNAKGGTDIASKSFQSLWDSINGEPRKDGKDISWNANPWVWVVEFEKI